ncbi:hypothetical protein A9Q84_07800 [Halobacteriovorax marinus]|uniref:DNA alkylation repair protein n=1 Tax=Halobacteriovorax marinus TaxID=97084 RepID=A0A1Y5FC98_9BACT|nr:hypothetical protein A9Q84_07800 [Halobacteriovorax marinus]
MSEALKNNYDKEYVQRVARRTKENFKSFKENEFVKFVLDKHWKDLELKDRMKKISNSLYEFLPKDYERSLKIILKTAPEFGGFEGMLFPDFVETYGFDKKNWEVSLSALEELTKYSSSEFAIRPFIDTDAKRVFKYILKWAKSDNQHVRRLASEGSRPRLPWAMALSELKKDPSQILPILEILKNDPELYVRRSVANNLNDISKDHPLIVIETAKKWLGKSEDTDWLIKHALRTLLKKGEPKALKLFGYQDIKSVSVKDIILKKKSIKIGSSLDFNFSLNLKVESKLRIEYAIFYVKKNGSLSKKVFKVTEKTFSKGTVSFSKSQSFKEMSTRKHYQGEHFISIIINGVEKKKIAFKVL